MSDEVNHVAGDGPRPGRKRSEHSHTAVLAATMALLQEVGYTALSLEAVAAKAGVGRATIYRWWPSKAALVIEALDDVIPTPVPVLTGDTRADVRTVIQGILDNYIRTPFGPTLAVLASDTAGDAEATRRLVDMFGPRRAAHASVVLTAASRGDLPHDVDVHLVLDIVMGTLIFRALIGVAPDEHLVDQLTDLLVSGTPPRTEQRH